MKSNLMTVNVKHLNEFGECIWSNHNLQNIIHEEGIEFILKNLFITGAGLSIPANYYMGLDNRTTPLAADTLADLEDEPSGNGYVRKAISSVDGFTYDSGEFKARSATLLFPASGGSWGPVQNTFLSTTLNNTGRLISSVSLGGSRSLTSGQVLFFEFVLGLESV